MPSWNCLLFMEPWRHECLEIFSSLLNYARRVEMSANVDYNWETVLHETRPHSVVSESLWFWAGGWGWGGGACPPGSGMSPSEESHLRAVTGTHFWSQDRGRKVGMEISEWKDSSVPVILPEGYLFIYFWCGPFLKSLLNLLQYCFHFMFWFLAERHVWS